MNRKRPFSSLFTNTFFKRRFFFLEKKKLLAKKKATVPLLGLRIVMAKLHCLWKDGFVGRPQVPQVVVFFRQGVPALHIMTRVARWYIFKPKKPIWANFGGS
jgi:hypothetical protein